MGTQTLREFFRTTYRPLRLRGRSAGTARLYDCLFTQFDKWIKAEGIADEGRIEHLEDLILARYLEHRAENHSAYTCEKERTQLLALARLAWERRTPGLDRMPSCPPSVLPDKVPTAWSVDELRRLFAAAQRAYGYVGHVPSGEWFAATLQLAYESGERIGAILSAKTCDYVRPTLAVRPEDRKGGRRGRVYALSEGLCDRLDRIIATHKSDALLPWPFAPTHVYHRLRSILVAAGLAGKRIAFHQVRRTAISHIAAAGGDPVAFAGHSNPATTRRWYLDPRIADRGPKPHELLPKLETPDAPAA